MTDLSIFTDDTKVSLEDKLKGVDKVLARPRGPERWREAVNFWLALNPANEHGTSAREENEIICQEAKAERDAASNKFGTSGDKNVRLQHGLHMPIGAKHFINMFDPELFAKDDWPQRLHKVFPEYRKATHL